jgi:hypothetical protein
MRGFGNWKDFQRALNRAMPKQGDMPTTPPPKTPWYFTALRRWLELLFAVMVFVGVIDVTYGVWAHFSGHPSWAFYCDRLIYVLWLAVGALPTLAIALLSPLASQRNWNWIRLAFFLMCVIWGLLVAANEIPYPPSCS